MNEPATPIATDANNALEKLDFLDSLMSCSFAFEGLSTPIRASIRKNFNYLFWLGIVPSTQPYSGYARLSLP